MADLRDAVETFAGALAEKLNTFVGDISELEVFTYTTPADQVEILVKGSADFASLQAEGRVTLRAYTKVSFDGDTTVCVPTDASGAVDRSLWDMHEAIVEKAMANRALMIESAGEAAASALRALGLARE